MASKVFKCRKACSSTMSFGGENIGILQENWTTSTAAKEINKLLCLLSS